MSFDLKHLLGTENKNTFLKKYWEQEPFSISRNDLNYYDDLICKQDLETVIRSYCLSETSEAVKLVRSQENQDNDVEERDIDTDKTHRPDLKALYDAYADGFTLVVNQIQHHWRPIGNMCGCLESELHHRVGVNLYYTPKNARGFQAHQDSHGVFILQLSGKKRWRLYGIGTQCLLQDVPHPPIDPDHFELSKELTLQPGDLLYIPRGYVHEALTDETSSMHLTVGFHVTTWLDVFQQTLCTWAAQDARLREALPVGFFHPSEQGRLRAQMSDLLANFTQLKPQHLERALEKSLGHVLQDNTLPMTLGHFDVLDELDTLNLDTPICRRPNMLCQVCADPPRPKVALAKLMGVSPRPSQETHATLYFRGNEVRFPAEVGPALHFIARAEHFRAKDLPGNMEPKAKLSLVQKLIKVGLLTFAQEEEIGSNEGDH